MQTTHHELTKSDLLAGTKFLHAYLECSDAVQAGIREMLAIVLDPDADPDDRDMAAFTLADALFPHRHEGQLGLDLEQSEQMGSQHSEETRGVLADFDREEQVFAERLAAAMKDRGLTQSALAELAGVGQPAISNILKRQCRPQRRTVVRLATALGMPPEELWPGGSTSRS